MHEGIDNLIEQVDIVEKHQEQMKADILDAVWERQTRWTVKKEVLFETLREIGTVHAAFSTLTGTFSAVRGDSSPELRQTNSALILAATEGFKSALYKLAAVRSLASVVASEKTRDSLFRLQILFGALAIKTGKGQNTDPKDNENLAALLAQATETIREELGVSDMKSTVKIGNDT
jgi:hypothetical protein